MVCRNLCQRVYVRTQASGSHWLAGNTAEDVNAILSSKVIFECCGMQLRANPHCERL
jgi:hypothetical protein